MILTKVGVQLETKELWSPLGLESIKGQVQKCKDSFLKKRGHFSPLSLGDGEDGLERRERTSRE